MKYRQLPGDFIVEEVANHKILSKGQFKIYTLEKEGIETLALLDMISRIYNIPRLEIGISGNKDTHAKTKQYITIPQKYNLKSTEEINIEFLGYVDKPLKLGDLLANKFIITVREIREEELNFVTRNAKSIKYGIPNYYDSQRFGSVVDNHFIGKYLIEKDFEGAVKHYLTSYYKNDSEELILDKVKILDSWPKFDITIENNDLRNVVLQYKKTKKWIAAYKYISKPLRLLFISAYQSYIWNECIKLLLKKQVDKNNLYSIPYVLGELIYNKSELSNIPSTFQTMSHRINPEKYEEEIISEVLEKEGISIPQFNIRKSGNFFKSQARDVMIYPSNFVIDKPIKTNQTYNMTVKFTLPKGSYATIVLKKIFEQ